MLKIYGNPVSFKVNKVRFLANYLGLEYELVVLNPMKGDLVSPEYLKINPIGKMPAITDADFALSESGAIMRYLANKAKSDLYPEEVQARALVDQWLDFTSNHVGTALQKVFFNTIIYKFLAVEKDERSLTEGREWAVNRFLPFVDKRLSEVRYLCGDKLSIADMNLLAYLDIAEPSQVDLSPFTHITKWRADLQAQEFYTKCHKNYMDVLSAAV